MILQRYVALREPQPSIKRRKHRLVAATIERLLCFGICCSCDLQWRDGSQIQRIVYDSSMTHYARPNRPTWWWRWRWWAVALALRERLALYAGSVVPCLLFRDPRRLILQNTDVCPPSNSVVVPFDRDAPRCLLAEPFAGLDVGGLTPVDASGSRFAWLFCPIALPTCQCCGFQNASITRLEYQTIGYAIP